MEPKEWAKSCLTLVCTTKEFGIYVYRKSSNLIFSSFYFCPVRMLICISGEEHISPRGHIFGLDKSCYTWNASSEAPLEITELCSKDASQPHLKSTSEDLISTLLLKNTVVWMLDIFFKQMVPFDNTNIHFKCFLMCNLFLHSLSHQNSLNEENSHDFSI